MYGDTARIRARARELRDLSGDVSARASAVDRSASIQWNSKTAELFKQQLAEQAAQMRQAARALEQAAESLEHHARVVDGVKQAIEDAAEWVSAVWHGAQRTVANIVETVADGVSAVFTLFGHAVSSSLAHRAEHIVAMVPQLPRAGSVEWLQLADTFSRNGWRHQ